MKHDDFEIKCVYAGPGMMDSSADSPDPADEPVKPTQSVYHCPKCGAPLPPDTRLCVKCGTLSERYYAMNGTLYAGPPIPSSQDSENKKPSVKSFFKKLYPWNHQKKQ